MDTASYNYYDLTLHNLKNPHEPSGRMCNLMGRQTTHHRRPCVWDGVGNLLHTLHATSRHTLLTPFTPVTSLPQGFGLRAGSYPMPVVKCKHHLILHSYTLTLLMALHFYTTSHGAARDREPSDLHTVLLKPAQAVRVGRGAVAPQAHSDAQSSGEPWCSCSSCPLRCSRLLSMCRMWCSCSSSPLRCFNVLIFM